MILVILISALLIETFITQLSAWRNHSWIAVYAHKWRSWFDKDGSLNEWLVAAITLLPPALIALLLLGDHRGFSGLVVEFVLSLMVLLWCLGPQTLSQYFHRHEQDAEGEPAKALLFFAHKAYFAPIFWFVLLGPIATLMYRLIESLAYSGSVPSSANSIDEADADRNDSETIDSMRQVWGSLFYWVDWIPARVSGFLYLLTGDFVRGFGEFKKGLLDTEIPSEPLVSETAVRALALREDDEPMPAARHLAERALLLLMVLVALISFFRL
jgi:AmpE protein